MDAPRKQLLVIGGGVGGYTAAIRAARHGLDVTLVECAALGGTCLNVGCIPTKSLLHQAHQFREAAGLAHFGVDAAALKPAIDAVMGIKDKVVSQLVQGVSALVRKNQVKLVQGTAQFTGPRTIRIVETGATYTPDFVVIASGSQPVIPPIPGHDLDGVITSDAAVALKALPASILIVGGGVIGAEFAQIFSDFNVKVTVVERLERLLAEEDADVAAVLQSSLVRRGVEIVTGATVRQIRRAGAQLQVEFAAGPATREVAVDLVLLAAGRKPRIDGLGLDEAGIECRSGAIQADDRCRTSVPGVYAVGDARGGLLLAHKAGAEAECAIADITGQGWSMTGRAIPRAVYTAPEVASVGLTEAEARKACATLKVGKFPFAASGKALASGHAEGFVKVMADAATDQVLGVAMVGPEVTNLLGEATLAVQMELTLPALMHTVHAHPTLTEALMEAAHDAFDGGAIHLLPRPAARKL